MSLSMIDRIVGYEKGKRLSALKVLSRGEEYLADHFPLVSDPARGADARGDGQAGAWLMRLSEGFSPPVIVLREARAVRYGNVVKPGDELRVEVELVHGGGGEASFKGSGRTGDKNAVLGRFVLRRVPLARLGPGLAQTDETIARLLEERLPSLMECDRGL